MPLIPAIPAAIEDGILRTGTFNFAGTQVSADIHADYKEKVRDIVKEFGKGVKIATIDVNGLRQRAMDLQAMKKIKIRKADIWLMTFIEDVGDVFDAFYMDIDSLLIPYHAVASDSEMKEMVRVSDRCVPSIFVCNGRAVSKTGPEDICTSLRKIKAAGFDSMVVLDIGGYFGIQDWERIISESEKVIPFVPGASDEFKKALTDLGFTDIMAPVS